MSFKVGINEAGAAFQAGCDNFLPTAEQHKGNINYMKNIYIYIYLELFFELTAALQ